MKWNSQGRSFEACDLGDHVQLIIAAGTPDTDRNSIRITSEVRWALIDRPGGLLSMIEIATPTEAVQIVATSLIARTLGRMLDRVAPSQQQVPFPA